MAIPIEDIVDLPLMYDTLQRAQDRGGETTMHLLLDHLTYVYGVGVILRSVGSLVEGGEVRLAHYLPDS